MILKMENKEDSKIKISDIVGNFKKADQGHVKASPVNTPRDSNVEDDDVITLNVGGVHHETRISTLLKKPETRLYSVAETAKACGKKEFYFDRNPQIFPCILNYYRIGKLHMPTDVCGPAAKAELDYWELEDKDVEQCCWVNYIGYEDTMEMLEKFEEDERDKFHPVYVPPDASFITRMKPRLWRGLQDPYSSKSALIFAIVSLVVVLISITVFVIETLPFFGSVFVHASDSSRNITSEDLRQEMQIFSDVTPNDCLLIIDNACNIYFFIEFIVKLVASPDKRKFFKSPLVITELLCLVPYYIGILIVMAHPEPIRVFLMIRVLFATRVLRIFRIFVLMKHFMALKILIYTIRASTKELFLLLVVLIIGVVIFACLEYYMEIFSNPVDLELEHIPLAFWWALITMTTVGYGDVVPKSGLGYLIGGFCAISGVLVIALSVPVIVKNFTIYYTHAQSREKLKLRKKKFEQTEKWQRLKAGLRSKLKSGALQNALNGIKKRNVINPNESKAAPKVPLLKLGGSIKPQVNDQLKVKSSEETSKSMPSTARDVILEDVAETEHEESTETSEATTVIATAKLANGTVSKPTLNGGTKHLAPQKNQVRSKFFGGSFKTPKLLRNGKKTSTSSNSSKDMELLHSKTTKKSNSTFA